MAENLAELRQIRAEKWADHCAAKLSEPINTSGSQQMHMPCVTLPSTSHHEDSEAMSPSFTFVDADGDTIILILRNGRLTVTADGRGEIGAWANFNEATGEYKAGEGFGVVPKQHVAGLVSFLKQHQKDYRSMEERAVSSDEARCCRICFDGEETSETGRLFSPCKCSGSMQFVHVACLNNWRAASMSDSSYFRCDACHYEYNLERVRFARWLLSVSLQRMVTIIVLVVGACLTGVVSAHVYPELVSQAMDRLNLPPRLRAAFLQPLSSDRGNSGCWNSGYTYELCCFALDGSSQGNPNCWDAHHTFDVCCSETSAALKRVQEVVRGPLYVLAHGGILFSLLGFFLWALRQLRTDLGNAHGQRHLALLCMSMATYNTMSLTRLAVILGTAVAYRELFLVLAAHAKLIASSLGDRVLEVP